MFRKQNRGDAKCIYIGENMKENNINDRTTDKDINCSLSKVHRDHIDKRVFSFNISRESDDIPRKTKIGIIRELIQADIDKLAD